ncbi:MAG: glycine--tRNA ligase subunit beta, partial [Anaerolineae bacterium]|nr:glycine--tRNA ligase subunit beta [Anaerolineae bacterium]
VDQKLGGTVRLADATPRRIALIVDDVSDRQADSEELVMGPPKAAALWPTSKSSLL